MARDTERLIALRLQYFLKLTTLLYAQTITDCVCWRKAFGRTVKFIMYSSVRLTLYKTKAQILHDQAVRKDKSGRSIELKAVY